MLAKVAHAFAVAELGGGFVPYLAGMVARQDKSETVALIGAKPECEPATRNLHELDIVPNDHGLLVVRVRLLANFETPTFLVVAGKRL